MSIFSKIPIKPAKHSRFNLSHDFKFSGDFGVLYPIFCEEVLPSDKFRISPTMLVKMAPMLAPVMHRVQARVHFFFVPNRLLWNNWESFITGGENGLEAPPPPMLAHPKGNGFTIGSLSDYLGFPAGDNAGSEGVAFSTLPHKAYHLIWNEYFRDQNLQQPFDYGLGDGEDIGLKSDGLTPNTWDDFDKLHHVCWRKDYFTSALPSPQRGPEVEIGLAGRAPVSGYFTTSNDLLTTNLMSVTGSSAPIVNGLNADTLVRSTVKVTLNGSVFPKGSLFRVTQTYPNSTSPDQVILQPVSWLSPSSPTPSSNSLSADLSRSTGVTIAKLRQAIKLQEYYELFARAGGRYIESLRSFFGVRPQDSRLQRPEFLGGGIVPIQIGEVLQNSASTTTSPQANMAGHGIAFGKAANVSKFFTEHGWVIGLLSILPDASYQDGLPRKFSRSTRFDYFWPQFQHIGEQAILNKELYYGNSNPDGTFGYTPRYSEYRYIPSRVAGDFRTTLNFWHLGRLFGSSYTDVESASPALNSDFVTVQTKPLNRIFSVTGDETNHFYVDVYFDFKASRPMSKFGIPKL